MAMASERDTIWDLVRQAAETLPEPFSRAALISWISKRRPDVELSSIGAPIQPATSNAANGSSNLAHRTPLLMRVDRGLYRRYRSATASSSSTVASEWTRAVMPQEIRAP